MSVWISLLQNEHGVTVMEFTGRLSMPGIAVTEVERTIKLQIDGGSRKLVLDLSKVEYLDSSGLGVLAVSARAMGKAGGSIITAGAHGRVEHVLLLTNLNRIIGMYPDVATACAALADTPTPASA
jgi:anti-sigma B factor antagonist